MLYDRDRRDNNRQTVNWKQNNCKSISKETVAMYDWIIVYREKRRKKSNQLVKNVLQCIWEDKVTYHSSFLILSYSLLLHLLLLLCHLLDSHTLIHLHHFHLWSPHPMVQLVARKPSKWVKGEKKWMRKKHVRGWGKGRMMVIVRKVKNGRKRMEERKKVRGEEWVISSRNRKPKKY